MLLVSYEPAFEMRRSNVAYVDHFFFVFLCAAIFFAFLVLDFFFLTFRWIFLSMKFAKKCRRRFFDLGRNRHFSTIFFFFSFSRTSTCANHTSQLCKIFSIYHIIHMHNHVLKRFNIFQMLID